MKVKKITLLGGDAVGNSGSSFLIETTAGKNILVDYGMSYNDKGEIEYPKIPAGKMIDLIILTHAHFDHSGGLPVLSRMFPRATIIMSRPTANLLFNTLAKNLRNSNSSSTYTFRDLHSINDKLFVVKSPKDRIEFKDKQGNVVFSILFGSSGHIRGAMWVILSDGKSNTMICGDMSLHNQTTILKATPPPVKIGSVFIEATNGNKERGREHSKEEARFVRAIKERIDLGGNIIIPASAISRGAEIAFFLARNGVQAHVDGAIRQTVSDMQKGDLSWSKNDVLPSIKEDLIIPIKNENRMSFIGEKNRSGRGKVVVSTSADLNHPPASLYVSEWLGSSKDSWLNRLFLAGFQHDGTAAKDIMETGRGEKINIAGQEMNLDGAVESFYMSAHSGIEDTIQFLRGLRPKNIFLTHSDKDASETMKGEIEKRLKQNNVVITTTGTPYLFE